FQIEAAKGNAEAEDYIGLQYVVGKGVSKDAIKAFEIISAAAQQRLVLAQYRLGFFYENGVGSAVNLAKAAEFYKVAAEQGLPDA
ncbi:sel1 repeat family protein, partial [Pseudomonas syringae pv. tagetis]|uniref:tetratricopeptide repeat protein n=1 Tax=Pseudomonas syringae group genomosp. 7 TaxID=251699 RepID=UPI0037704F26